MCACVWVCLVFPFSVRSPAVYTCERAGKAWPRENALSASRSSLPFPLQCKWFAANVPWQAQSAVVCFCSVFGSLGFLSVLSVCVYVRLRAAVAAKTISIYDPACSVLQWLVLCPFLSVALFLSHLYKVTRVCNAFLGPFLLIWFICRIRAPSQVKFRLFFNLR